MTTHGGNIFAIARRYGWDWREIADFSASINPLGPSPKVKPAIAEAMERIAHYPEAYSCGLQQALAEHWQTDPAGVMPGNGATELLHFFARSLEPRRVYLAAPVFSEFHRAFPHARIVPFDAAQWPADGLVVVTRPANPTGRMPALPAVTTYPLLVDESFIEFTGEPALNPGRDNLFILRSLTKFHAIPGLRAGALLGPPAVLESWKQRREPWQVNVLRRRRSSPRSPMRTTRGVRWISSMANASGLPANWVRNRAPPTFCSSSSTCPLHRSSLASSNRRF